MHSLTIYTAQRHMKTERQGGDEGSNSTLAPAALSFQEEWPAWASVPCTFSSRGGIAIQCTQPPSPPTLTTHSSWHGMADRGFGQSDGVTIQLPASSFRSTSWWLWGPHSLQSLTVPPGHLLSLGRGRFYHFHLQPISALKQAEGAVHSLHSALPSSLGQRTTALNLCGNSARPRIVFQASTLDIAGRRVSEASTGAGHVPRSLQPVEPSHLTLALAAWGPWLWLTPSMQPEPKCTKQVSWMA